MRNPRRGVVARIRIASGLALGLLSGCATPAFVAEPLAGQCSPIVGGEPDAEHSGVMALLGPDGALVCSGTLIRAEPRPAVLTAAHCFADPIALAAVGSDYEAPDRLAYDAGEFVVHPAFDRGTGEFDFGVLMLEGAVDPAWVVPVLSAADDALAEGTLVQFVGYGSTEGLNPNRLRNEVGGVITGVTPTTFDYQQADGGPCAGDSGGPALVDVGGRPFVAGVTSYGDGRGCWSRGVSARVSAASDFLDALVPHAGTCPPNQERTQS